jgi:uncharacterized protein (DUF1697 family)
LGLGYGAGVPTHVALLRGINVGGRNKVAMADLRAVVTSLGHADVATYIQSGNVVFTARATDPALLAADLEAAIAQALDVRPRVVVVSREELAQVVRDNPYSAEANPKSVHAVFLGEYPAAEMVDHVADAQRQARLKGSRDTAQYVGRILFLHTPDGFGRSELAALLARPGGPTSVRGAGTARNWVTVTRLLAMCEA